MIDRWRPRSPGGLLVVALRIWLAESGAFAQLYAWIDITDVAALRRCYVDGAPVATTGSASIGGFPDGATLERQREVNDHRRQPRPSGDRRWLYQCLDES
jgi:hypothetical protein